MALERKDRVKDQTTTTGTGTVTIAGLAPAGYRTITSAHTSGATVRYTILTSDLSEWEVGQGVWTAAGTTLTRVTVYASSNAGALVNFSAGTKIVFTGPVAEDTLAYAESTWTPALTFATPGDLSIAYTVNTGLYTKIGRLVVVQFVILTSTFTHTTASGAATITGFPFTVNGAIDTTGVMEWQGITKANYTQVNPRPTAGDTTALLKASGSGQALSDVAAADMPTGGTVLLRGTVSYCV